MTKYLDFKCPICEFVCRLPYNGAVYNVDPINPQPLQIWDSHYSKFPLCKNCYVEHLKMKVPEMELIENSE